MIRSRLILIFILSSFLYGCNSDNLSYMSFQDDNYDLTINIILEGAINFPGPYTVKKGITLSELINFAGGLRNDADIKSINNNMIIEEDMVYKVPSVNDNYKVEIININRASITELLTLPRIGNAKALAIIEYRTLNGSFKSIEDIMKVPGIGQEIFNTIKDIICI